MQGQQAAASGFTHLQLFVSPLGRDGWSGRLPAPAANGRDGPLATLAGARDRVRRLKEAAALPGPVTVWLRGGRYPVTEPVRFGPEDSAPVTYAAYPGEQPVIEGGRRIEGWRVEQREGRDVWVIDLAEVAEGRWYFRQLFVNGRRCPRPRLPKEGFLRIAEVPGVPFTGGWGHGGSHQFRVQPGDIRAWRNLTDVEVVALHYWIEERFPIAALGEESALVTSTRTSVTALKDDRGAVGARYYVDNVFEALSEPGEWYLDRATGRLTYLPLPGEKPDTAEACAPAAMQLIELVGDPDAGRWVEFLRFQNLHFEHTDWAQPDDGRASAAQAAANIPGTILLEGARSCAIEDCRIFGVGGYAIQLGDGCLANRIVGNEITEMGAGGIAMSGSDASGSQARRTGNNRVTDNHIHAGGRVFHSAVGILSRHSFGNVIAHNHIHDLYYTGISVGWVWGYAESVSKNNLVEKNHIHDLGQGWLSDMGGIYTLGVQPGTVLRGNLIHDVQKATYGGWAIYPDEGSSHLIIEGNVCYDTNGEIFHQHYGRENTVRNNIFAFGQEAIATYTRPEPHVGFTLERNILVSDGVPLLFRAFGPEQRRIISDLNLFWDVSGAPVLNADRGDAPSLSFEEWQARGYDRHSRLADPLFGDPASRDFTLREGSPALTLGFEPIDLSDVGPRPREQRG